MKTRTKDLYLFNYDHFKEPTVKENEQYMQWELITQKAVLRLLEPEVREVFICGSEIPLGEVRTEKKTIDLVAYDNDMNLYVIELKLKLGSGTANSAARQVDAYAKELVKNAPRINKIFKEKMGKDWLIKEPLKKIVLAPKSFFDHKRKPDSIESKDVLYVTFKGCDEYKGLESVISKDGFVDLIEYIWK